MSREIHYYKDINSQTAYIAGVLDMAIGDVSVILGKEHYCIDTDIFWTGTEGIDGIYSSMLTRLRKYNDIDKLPLDLEYDSFMPNLPVNKLEGDNTTKSVTKVLYNYVKDMELEDKVKSFFFTMNWYLNLPTAVYKMDMDALYEFMPDLEKALRAFYTFVICDILFVEYQGYVMMLVIGAEE